MTVESRWKQEFEILTNYITSNPEISIGIHEIFIPEELRDKFYLLFDNVRKAIVESWIGSFDFDVHTLGKDYIEAENELAEGLNLKHMDLPVDLASFLETPREGMMRMLYNRLFELLQGKITEDDFQEIAKSDLTAGATEMFRLAYEPWAFVSLLLLLEPDEITGVGLNEKDIYTTSLDQIVIGKQAHHPAKRIPEFIIHSKKLDSYIAVRMPVTREVDSYYLPVEIPTQRVLRDRTGDTSSVLGYRMIFLAVVQDLKKLPIFADIHERKVNGPDLTIEFLMGHDLSDPGIIGQIQNRLEILKPRLGGNIVIMDPEPKSGFFKIKENIDTYSVGFSQVRLQPIIDKLVS